MKIVDFYLKRPILIDFIIAGMIITGLVLALHKGLIKVPTSELAQNLITDMANLSFTSSGFVLTILTVLITFKASSKRKQKVKEYESALHLFFQTPLYIITANLLKNCIKSLVFIAISGFMIKAFLSSMHSDIVFFYGIFGLIILALTLIRCMLVLAKVLKLQS